MAQNSNIANLKEILSYTPPRLFEGKEWYIGFRAWDPAQKKMRRKKIKLNHVIKLTDRRKYATDLLKRLTQELSQGWNPWIESEDGTAYKTFEEALQHYERHITQLAETGYYREYTFTSYMSLLRNLKEYNEKLLVPIYYIYQFNTKYVIEFLNAMYLTRKNSLTTRDNYLAWLRTFSTFLVQNFYLKTKPTEGITSFAKRMKKKKRTVIAKEDLIRLSEYLKEDNKFFLLGCYILHYCFIRPHEMAQIKLEHISVKNKTIFIPEDNSKNRQDAVVTIPDKVMKLMLELNVFNFPSSFYLFSNDFMPGRELKPEKRFRDYFAKVRKTLKMPDSYKFYSLKDTGITTLLKEKMDLISVRDQARHSSILMTDLYTPHDIQEANSLIAAFEGVF